MLISEIFTSIQGEGPQTGIPMTFIRTQGCSVGCSWCDTKYSWNVRNGNNMDDATILSHVHTKWVCVTGGEPLEVPLMQMRTLTRALRKKNCLLCLETSGVGGSEEALSWFDYVTISPKAHAPVEVRFLAQAHCIKVVVSDGEDVRRALKYRDMELSAEICLQPVHGSADALLLCINECKAQGVRLSLQTHKIISQR